MKTKSIFLLVIIVGVLLVSGIPSKPVSAVSYNCSAQHQIPQKECKALVSLYNNTVGTNWYLDNNWLVTNPCSWYGVTCSGSPGYVSHIDLNDNNLNGTLQLSIGDFFYLSTMDLSSNWLSGSIPYTFGKLKNLDALDLSSNQLTGAIPPAMGNMTDLTVLDLHNNSLGGAMPDNLGNLANLGSLFLHDNNLVGSIPTSFGNLIQLDRLILTNNLIIGNIPVALTTLSDLDSLNINNTHMSGVMPSQITSLSLTTFDFGNTRICEPTTLSYAIWKVSLSSVTDTGPCVKEFFYSQAAYDGWIRESAENSNTGGLLNTSDLVFRVGDANLDKQYRGFLHYVTTRLPDNAKISQVSVQIKLHSIDSTDPFTTHGKLWVDVKNGVYGASAPLVVTDFAAASSTNFAGSFSYVPSLLAYKLYRASLKYEALDDINLTGPTQFRLRFNLDDNNDDSADYLKLFSGNMPVPFNRPVLRVWYYVP